VSFLYYAGEQQIHMKSWLLFLILAVLLGAGSWVVLGSGPTVAEDHATDSALTTTDSPSTAAANESSTTESGDNISSAVDRKELEAQPSEAGFATGLAPELPFEGPAATIKLKLVDGNGNPIEDGTAKFALTQWQESVGELDWKEWNKVNTLAVSSTGEMAAAVPVGHGFNLEIGGAFWRSQRRLVQPLELDEIVDLGEVALTPANRVAGIVKNADGQPLHKAQVVISETNGSMWGGDFQELELTDEEGKFAFDGVRSGRFKFQISAQGYVRTILRAEHIKQRQGEFPLEIVLERGKSTRGRVVDEDGVGIAGAEVYTLDVEERMNAWRGSWNPPIPSKTEPATVADANGDFVVYGLADDGNTRMGAKAEGYGTGYAEEVKVDGNATIQLPRHYVVSGVVVAGGKGVEAATVNLQRFREDGEKDWGGRATTDENGKFDFKPLAPGSYTLNLTSALGVIENETLEVTADLAELRYELPLDNVLAIYVKDANGQAIAGAKVSLSPEQQGDNNMNLSELGYSGEVVFGGISFSGNFNRGANASHTAKTDLDGLAKFAAVPASRYELGISADDFATAKDPLEVTGTTQEHHVELNNGGNLRVRVVDALAQPVVGIQVALRTADAEKEMRTLATDAAGRAIWNDLEDGEYQVSYSASETDGWWWNREDDPEAPVDQITVKVKAGKTTDFELAVSDLALVTVHVTRHGGNAEDVKVSIAEVVEENHNYWGGSMGNGTPTDGRGEVELQPVTAGEYEITVKANKASPATKLKVNLHVGPQRVEIQLDGGSVSGKLTESAGGLSNATVALVPVDLDPEENQRNNISFVSYGVNGSYNYGNSNEQLTNTRTDRYGNYEFSDVPDGRWQVVARAKGFGAWTSDSFMVQGGTAVDLNVHQMYPGGIIQGHDYNFVPRDNGNNNNRRSYGSRIRLTNGENVAISRANADENGDFIFEDLPGGTYYLSRRQFKSEPIEVSAGGTYRVDIPLEEPKENQ
jgi:protocatechuate 3,4-dioxygenase beta subunit